MKVLLMGLPGSGKSTQAQKISEYLGVKILRMGDLLRTMAKEETTLGRRIRKNVEAGVLVKDDTVVDVIKQKVEEPDYQAGFVMDGYPRTINQLKMFNPGFDKVFYLKLTPKQSKDRLYSRGRSDDTKEVIETRTKVQQKELRGLINYYKKHTIFYEIDASQNIAAVEKDIMKGLRG